MQLNGLLFACRTRDRVLINEKGEHIAHCARDLAVSA